MILVCDCSDSVKKSPLLFLSFEIKIISSDEFSVATPDETTGKETEFSLVGRNKKS